MLADSLYSLGQSRRNTKWLQRLLLWNDSAFTLSPLGNGSSLPTLMSVHKTGSIVSDRLLLHLLYMSDGGPLLTLTSLRSVTFFSLSRTATTGFITSLLNCTIIRVKQRDGLRGGKVMGVFKETVFQDNLRWECTKIISEFKNFLRDKSRQILRFTYMRVVKNGIRGVHASTDMGFNNVVLILDSHSSSDIVIVSFSQEKGLW